MKYALPFAAVLALSGAACAGNSEMIDDDMSASAMAGTTASASTAARSPAVTAPRTTTPTTTGVTANAGVSAQTNTGASAGMNASASAMNSQQAHEAALRQLITGLQAGTPDYTKLAPNIADPMRGQQAAMTARMAPRGAIQNIEYLDTDANGQMRFRVRYTQDSSIWGLTLDNQGRISGLSVTD